MRASEDAQVPDFEGMTNGPPGESILFLEANFTGVAEDRCILAWIHFADVRQFPSGAREPAGPSGDVQRIGNNREQRLRERGCGGNRWIDGECVSRFGRPVVLDVEYDGTSWARLWSTEQ